MRYECRGSLLMHNGTCGLRDVTMSSLPHLCLRWLTVIGDEDGCAVRFQRLGDDQEITWRLDHPDGPAHEGVGS